MKNFKNSKKRFILLLAQLSIIWYTILTGDKTAKILALGLMPAWLYAASTWRQYE